ncbi:MAG: recombination mediator RecR [Deltaproteobacteria bacterium]|jgi:recombination protein RecR|nr:recombination mediator RecR [Deltaproteobacteria bacterium]
MHSEVPLLSKHPPQLARLIELLARLPGLGVKSATRLSMYFLSRDIEEVRELAAALIAVKEEIGFCSVCHNYAQSDPCPMCQDDRRDQGQICVVETPADLLAIESSGLYHGLYHVLGGVLSPLSGIGPRDLHIDSLLDRLAIASEEGRPVREVLLATGSSPEAESTCVYLGDRLKETGATVTRLARGLPVGVDLEYVDNVTLRQALEFRREA